jgi:L-cystine uptake protein TcyP (sodium:dicarboxylate symporter family)
MSTALAIYIVLSCLGLPVAMLALVIARLECSCAREALRINRQFLGAYALMRDSVETPRHHTIQQADKLAALASEAIILGMPGGVG